MFKHILLAVDGSTHADRAARHGIGLAKALTAKVTVVTVTVPWETQFAREVAVVAPEAVVPKEEFDRKTNDHARDLLGLVSEAANTAGVPCMALHLSHAHPYLAIIDAANAQGCDLIVMGSHGRRGITGLLLGSETVKVLTHCKTSVLVHRYA